MQHELQPEVQRLIMLCICSVSLLFSLVILNSNSLLSNLMVCLDKFANSKMPNAGS